jgi:hypothetical protein
MPVNLGLGFRALGFAVSYHVQHVELALSAGGAVGFISHAETIFLEEQESSDSSANMSSKSVVGSMGIQPPAHRIKSMRCTGDAVVAVSGSGWSSAAEFFSWI